MKPIVPKCLPPIPPPEPGNFRVHFASVNGRGQTHRQGQLSYWNAESIYRRRFIPARHCHSIEEARAWAEQWLTEQLNPAAVEPSAEAK